MARAGLARCVFLVLIALAGNVSTFAASRARAQIGTAECRDPEGAGGASSAHSIAGPVAGVDAGSAEARAAANETRRVVLAGEPDAGQRIEAALAAARALPEARADRSSIVLHVLRSRMLGLELGVGSKADDVKGADRAALDRDFTRLAASAKARGELGPAAWAQVYGAELALERGERPFALALLDGALRIAEDDSTWEAHVAAEGLRERALLAGAADAVVDPALRTEAIRGLERARRILARMRPRIEGALFLERARPIHERLAALRLAEPMPMEERARAALEALEALKLAELRAYFGDACLAELAPTMPESVPGTLVLYPAILGDTVELIIGHAGHWSHRRAPISAAELTREAGRLRGALQDPTSARFRSAASRLHAALVRPLDAELAALRREAEAAGSTLVVVPSGGLRAIPFAALLDERTGRFLIEDVALATLPSLHILPAAPLDARRLRLLAVGLTDAVDGFSPLPFAARELAAASDRFPGRRRLDADFSKAAFATALGSEPFDVVHIASHGRFDARASESFVLAHDGRIGMADLDDLIAATRARTGRPLELLVLSACETAIGDERASLGLAGVAVQAGARSAIASLWKVHDEATMRLFGVFYRELGLPGVSRAEALRRAQTTLLAEPRFRHPIFWSAFLLVSGWR